jgi:hypothetical protein
MNASAAQQMIPDHPGWRMPIHPERYDRSPLSEVERREAAARALAAATEVPAPVPRSVAF